MKTNAPIILCKLLAAGGVCLALVVGGNAQVQTETSTSVGRSYDKVDVQRGTVVLVDGNDLIVKMEDGSLRHIANVPESARVLVDGKELGIHDLKPGMTLQRTIITTTTPKTITTVQNVTGTVWHVTPPLSLILTLEDGTNQSFKIPKGQRFNVNGQMVDAWGLKKGMIVNATRVVETPVSQVSETRHITGEMPPPPVSPAPDVPVLVAEAPPSPAPAAQAQAQAEPAPAELPKTGSPLPLVALFGILCIGLSSGIRSLIRS
jgi:hypothetical protein